ncbi:MAG: hypothetical protein WA156_00015 [Methylocystis silviterrae]
MPSIAEKVRFLSAPDSYPHASASVAVLETHMSYVFLAGDKVYKLKSLSLPGAGKESGYSDATGFRARPWTHAHSARSSRRKTCGQPITVAGACASGPRRDGHGDLRPEHICFRDPTAIFDCLEFNAELRQVDPFDELAYLGVECALIGAKMLGAEIAKKVASRLSCEAPRRLISLYAAWRAMLRARQSVAHLLDYAPQEPTKWEPAGDALS